MKPLAVKTKTCARDMLLYGSYYFDFPQGLGIPH